MSPTLYRMVLAVVTAVGTATGAAALVSPADAVPPASAVARGVSGTHSIADPPEDTPASPPRPPATAAADASYTSQNLPSWAIGPFVREPDRPILKPSGNGFEAAALYNPGVLYRGGRYEMLYRAQSAYGAPSEIGYASSTDGIHFRQDTADNPVINFAMAGTQDKCGLEDPRLLELGGTYYSFFTSVHPKANGTCLGSYDISESTSTDAIHWSTPRVVEPDVGSNKDAAVVTNPNGTPVKVNGEYVMYFGQGSTGSYIAYSSDLLTWHARGSTTPRTADRLDLHYPNGWQPYEVCTAVTDYRTTADGSTHHDIVLFTAGTLMSNKRWFYAISEEQFSGTQPTKMLHQLSDAVLTPTPDVPYQWNGQTPKTVWTNSVFFHHGQWMMYYGAGDTVTALATAGLRRMSHAHAVTDQFQTGFEHGQPMPDWIDSVDTSAGGGGIAGVSAYDGASGPESSVRQENAHDGTNALMYSGRATGAADDRAYMRVFDLSDRPVRVHRRTVLSYWIYPQAKDDKAPGVSGDNSSCVSLDLIFADGTALRSLRAKDEQGDTLTPAGQCGHLPLDHWDHVTADIGTVAAGQKIVRIDVGFGRAGGEGGYRGYVDDIAVTSGNHPHTPTITGITPTRAAPGARVTVSGTGFGRNRHHAHLLLSDLGTDYWGGARTNWGGAGDLGTLTIDSWSDRSIVFTVPQPSGPAVATQSGPINIWRVEPGSTASVVVVTGPGSVSGARRFTVADTDVLYDYFDDVGISPASNPGCGSFDNGTDTYPAAELVADGLRPGANVVAGGLTFTWPDVQPCNNDNVRALGQTILLPRRAAGVNTIGFLGAATDGDRSDTVAIHYADGSTGTATLAQTDWGGRPESGNLAVATTTYRNEATGPDTHDFFVNEQSIPVDPHKTAVSITLPQQKDMHIFAISEG